MLLAYFALWYLGNYYYNITNKLGAWQDSSETLCSISSSPGVLIQAGLEGSGRRQGLPDDHCDSSGGDETVGAFAISGVVGHV